MSASLTVQANNEVTHFEDFRACSYSYEELTEKALEPNELSEISPDLYRLFCSLPVGCPYAGMLCLYLGWIDKLSVKQGKLAWVASSNWARIVRGVASFEIAILNEATTDAKPLTIDKSGKCRGLYLFGKQVSVQDLDEFQQQVIRFYFEGGEPRFPRAPSFAYHKDL